MNVRIAHNAEWDEFQREAKKYIKEQGCMIWKKALKYKNTRRAGLLKGFQEDIDCYDWGIP